MMSWSNSFAGGVFLGAGLIHLLPESTKAFADLGIDFGGIPMAHLLAASGFLFVFLIEKVIFLGHHGHEHGHSHGHSHSHSGAKREEDRADLIQENPNLSNRESSVRIMLEETNTIPSPQDSPKSGVTLISDTILVDAPPSPNPSPDEGKSLMLAVLLMLVLSVHSFISGLTVGVLQKLDLIVSIGIAIISHKWIEAFALGISLTKANLKGKQFAKYVLLYSIMEPLGVLLGIALQVVFSHRAAEIIESIVSGIAGGTFIYISLVDILLPEFESPTDKYHKFSLAIAGFFAIMIPLIFDED
jgi:zinc transporter 1/2/3